MDIIIREEQPSDYWETENMTKRAFWNWRFVTGFNNAACKGSRL